MRSALNLAGAHGRALVDADRCVASRRPRAGLTPWVRTLACGLLSVAAALAQAAAVSVPDDAGATIRLSHPAHRIVTLAPNLTELVAAAGGLPDLVAVSRFSDYPPEVRHLPVVSDAFGINLEAIARLKPDLLVVWRSGLEARQRERLRALGVAVFDSEIDTVQGIASTLRRLGVLMGTEPTADAAAAEVEQQWRTLLARYRGASPVRVFYQAWGQPLMTLNGRHLISQAMAACGGVNVFAALSPLTPTVSWEAVLATQPQLVITDRQAAADTRALWQRMATAVLGRPVPVAGVNADLTTRMGPRFVQGAQELCAAIDRVRAEKK
jgi:iron complex transport system substrate-binding protein